MLVGNLAGGGTLTICVNKGPRASQQSRGTADLPDGGAPVGLALAGSVVEIEYVTLQHMLHGAIERPQIRGSWDAQLDAHTAPQP
jgi:hypothetical protein